VVENEPGCFVMKSRLGDRLLGSASKTGGPVLRASKDSLEYSRRSSRLYFVKSKTHLVDTVDTRRFSAKEVTVIYLSFTNVRISIALPGGGVSLEGGVNGTHGRK
jgi:hypothetical protein